MSFNINIQNNINIDYQNINNNINLFIENSEETEIISNSFFQSFKKKWDKKYIPIDIKYIEKGEKYAQCMVSYNDIKPQDEYIKCGNCDKIFSVCVKTQWIDKKRNCPHCRTEWKNYTIYINGENNYEETGIFKAVKNYLSSYFVSYK